jgi:phosphogluconate dehydratase
VEAAYKAGELAGRRHRGAPRRPAANGMPELHKLMPVLATCLRGGSKVALVTDGSHLRRLRQGPGRHPRHPEALHGGAIGLLADGDLCGGCRVWPPRLPTD